MRLGTIVITTALTLLAGAGTATAQDWDELAQCESSGDWSANTGNGFSGGLQFTPSTWRAFGGTGNAAEASRTEQIAVAERVLAAQGSGAWPACSSKTDWLSGSTETPLNSSDSNADSLSPSKGVMEPAESSSEIQTNSGSYTVRSGDTLGSIAATLGTTWRDLYAANTGVVTDPHRIYPGQVLAH